MTSTIFNRYVYLRIATGIILIFLIGFKIVSPVLHLKALVKVSAITSQPTDNDSEKKVEINAYIEKELFSFFKNELSHPRYYTDITHLTAYQNNYATSYYSTITIPPPDIYLQPAV